VLNNPIGFENVVVILPVTLQLTGSVPVLRALVGMRYYPCKLATIF
jgi:hypothetical protein